MNILFPVPAGQNDYNPIVRSLNAAAESLDTVISPGFVNKILSVGNTINPDDMLLISYANGSELFIQNTSNEGVITLSPANETIPFNFTNVQFVAQGGSDLNPGNNMNQPKLNIQAAIDAVTAGGLVWVLDSGIYSQPLTFNKGMTVYAPNVFFEIDAISGSLITQADTGGGYIVNFTAQSIEVVGGANFITQNGSFSTILLNAEEIIGIGTLNGTVFLNTLFMSGVLNFLSTSRVLFNVAATQMLTLNTSIGAQLEGKLGNNFYGTQTFINQVISQQIELQETSGRTLGAGDSNSTVNYMSVSLGNYVLPNSGIPVGTIIEFMQLSSGVVEFDSDGTSTILSFLNASPVVTGGLNAVAYAEQISQGIWMISGNIIQGGGGG